MTYRSLLVHLDQDALCGARMRFAIGLAKRFNAHLTGLAPTGVIELPSTLVAAASLADFAALAWSSLRDEADASARAFDRACAAAEFSASDSIVDKADIALSMLRHALCHDLTVLSQPDPGVPGHALKRDWIEQLVLYSARPMLMLPYAGSFEPPAQNILVAWDGSREAVRAVADALPLLHQARHVHVVAWQERGLLTGSNPIRLDDLRRWLAWHGVEAQVRMEQTSAPIAEAMLSLVCDLEADLVVMGAYGHTRWTERVLGGATRGLLASMTVPVLMSH